MKRKQFKTGKNGYVYEYNPDTQAPKGSDIIRKQFKSDKPKNVFDRILEDYNKMISNAIK